MEAWLSKNLRQVIRCGGIQGIDAAHALKELRILLQHSREVTIVVAVMDHLDNDSLRHPVGFHEFQQHLRRGSEIRNLGSGRERKASVVLPHMHVRVEYSVI